MSDSVTKKCQALVLINEEILNRIKSTRAVTYMYSVTHSEPNEIGIRTLELKETQYIKTAADVLSSWTCLHTFSDIPTVFSQTINTKITTFKELETLIISLSTIVRNCVEFFGIHVTDTMPGFVKIKNNLEVVQVCLGELEQLMQGSESQRNSFNERISLINSEITKLNKDIKTINQSTNLSGFHPFCVTYSAGTSIVNKGNNVFSADRDLGWTESFIRCDSPLDHGIFRWTYTFSVCPQHMMFGVIPSHIPISKTTPYQNDCLFWFCNIHTPGTYNYGKFGTMVPPTGGAAIPPSASGNRYEFTYNSSKKNLAISVNGQNIGVFAENLPGPINPIMALYTRGSFQFDLQQIE